MLGQYERVFSGDLAARMQGVLHPQRSKIVTVTQICQINNRTHRPQALHRIYPTRLSDTIVAVRHNWKSPLLKSAKRLEREIQSFQCHVTSSSASPGSNRCSHLCG